VFFGWPYPQRKTLGLHGLGYHRQQLGAELLQVGPLASCGGKTLDGSHGVVLLAVETAVDESLDAPAEGREQCGNGQGREHVGGGRLVTDDHCEQALQKDDAAEKDQG